MGGVESDVLSDGGGGRGRRVRGDSEDLGVPEVSQPISDFGLLQRIHPGHALTYMRTDRDEAGKRIGRVLGWDDGKMVAIREDGAAVEVRHG